MGRSTSWEFALSDRRKYGEDTAKQKVELALLSSGMDPGVGLEQAVQLDLEWVKPSTLAGRE